MASSSAIDRDIDADAVAALQNAVLDWRYKAAPASAAGETAGSFVAAHPTLASFSTPLLTLDRAAVHHNLDRLAHWCAERGVLLAPHGKTTMAPQLWAEQLQRGAWGITLANFAQLRVARAFGVRRLQLANSLTDPQAISWVAEETAAGRPVLSWVDAEETVERIGRVLSAAGSTAVLDILVELGGHGGRTGARSVGADRKSVV